VRRSCRTSCASPGDRAGRSSATPAATRTRSWLGICDALRDAELLAEALTDGLSGRRPAGDALADYERRRDETTRDDFRANLARAQLGPLPEPERRLRAALRFDEDATRHFFLAIQGMVAPESFFNDENIDRIVSAAPAAPPG
jgi:hypothetical protein